MKMVKGKAGNSKQEAMGPPMTRKSRRRGYPVEKMTEDDHQDLGEVNAEDTLVQYLQFPEEKSNKKCIEPLESSSISDGNTNDKNDASETLEVTTVGLKTQSVILLSDSENESNQNKIDEQEQVPNKSESLNSSHKYIDVNDGLKPCSEEQMSAEDNHPKMKTNQELDEVKPISTEPEVIGTAKKRRRMGMCRASEKELRLFLPKCGNRAEKSEKQNKNTLVAEEEKGTSVKVLSPQQQATEMMQHLKAESSQNIKDVREENKVETAATGITTVCEPLSTEMHVSEDDPKGAHSEGFTKHRTQEEKGLQRTESGCCPDEAAPKSSLSVYKSENAKSMEYHHCPEGKPTGEKMKCQETVLDNPCKDDTELDLIQASDQRPETELQQNKAETETHLTAPDALLPNLENWETAQKAHLDKEQQLNSSETEVNWTAFLSNVADSACERQTTKDHLEPDQTALLNEKKQMNEGQPQKEAEATFTKIHRCENKCSDGDSENCNVKIKMNLTETPMEQDSLHQQDMNEKTSLENCLQGIGDNPHLIHTSLSDSVLETNCSSREHSHLAVMNSNCEEKKLHDTDSTLNMRPSESREDVSDSQLNTIDITDQLTDDGIRVSSECYEDVTELVGGLIRELSSLNRAVMATHRELENLRRKGKNPRNASR